MLRTHRGLFIGRNKCHWPSLMSMNSHELKRTEPSNPPHTQIAPSITAARTPERYNERKYGR